MGDEYFRFRKLEADSAGIVAVAEVRLFRGVWLRGWNIVKNGPVVEVLPPYKVYRDPQTGQKRVLPLLVFESDETRDKWLEKVKEEYLAWEAAQLQASSSSIAP